MKRQGIVLLSAVAAMAVVLSACGSSTTGQGSAPGSSGPYKIALSMSYSGNNWQEEASNLVKAAAATPPYDKKVILRVDIAGADVTKQIQTLNNEIAAGMNAIIVYPISPTALNATIKKACDAGIVVYAYDSLVTEPCAYNAHLDQYQWGLQGGKWLGEALHGTGKIADITGVPGTSVDTDRQKGVMDALANYPGIEIAGKANGAWAQAQGKTAFQSIEAAHPDLAGVITETGCFSITQYLISSGKKPLPCAGETTNGHLMYMMSPEVCAQVGVPTGNCISLSSWGMASPVYTAELAFQNSVRILNGEKIAHNIIIPPVPVTTDTISALGTKAFGTNPAQGAVVFPPDQVPSGYINAFWSPVVEQGLQAAIHGISDKISVAKNCSEVEGCQEKSGLTADPNHSGGN